MGTACPSREYVLNATHYSELWLGKKGLWVAGGATETMTAKEKLFTSLWLYDTREFQIKQPSKQQKEEKKKKGRKKGREGEGMV